MLGCLTYFLGPREMVELARISVCIAFKLAAYSFLASESPIKKPLIKDIAKG